MCPLLYTKADMASASTPRVRAALLSDSLDAPYSLPFTRTIFAAVSTAHAGSGVCGAASGGQFKMACDIPRDGRRLWGAGVGAPRRNVPMRVREVPKLFLAFNEKNRASNAYRNGYGDGTGAFKLGVSHVCALGALRTVGSRGGPAAMRDLRFSRWSVIWASLGFVHRHGPERGRATPS
jgi:hypothetical protein